MDKEGSDDSREEADRLGNAFMENEGIMVMSLSFSN